MTRQHDAPRDRYGGLEQRVSCRPPVGLLTRPREALREQGIFLHRHAGRWAERLEEHGMAGRQKTTFAKMSRETKVSERKAIKEMRKRQRREEIDRAHAEGREVWATVDADDTSLDRPDRLDLRTS
jgi:hypothetical protein